MSDRLVDAHDVVYFDLDGVLYLGPDEVPGASAALSSAAGAARLVFVTNNAARSAAEVAGHLSRLGFHAAPDDVITSVAVTAAMLPELLPTGSTVLAVGTANLDRLLIDAGYQIVESADDAPDAVVQGYDPAMTWPRLDEAAIAVQRGARWFATNDDATRPTNRGLVPGLAAAIHAVALTVDERPQLFGKPHEPMFTYAQRLTGAERPLFVGDRLDTDIEGACRAEMPSLMVFSGAHGKRDLIAALPGARPTFIGGDVAALLRPARTAEVLGDRVTCGRATARLVGGEIVLDALPQDREGQFDALWALVTLAWAHPSALVSCLDDLTLVP